MKLIKLGKRVLALGLCVALLSGDAVTIAAESGNISVANTESTQSTEKTENTEGTEGTEVPAATETSEMIGQTESVETETASGVTEDVIDIAENAVPMAVEQVRFDYQSALVNVIVTLSDEKDLPENAELVVTPVEVTTEMQNTIQETVEGEGKSVESVTAFDISFVVDGKEVEPGATVKVQISLPEVSAGDSASVYHYDEEADAVEDMDAEVTEEGNVEFDTTHFSTYVIVNEGEKEISVTIEHLGLNTSEDGTQSYNEIYAKDKKTLPYGSLITNFKKLNNWEIDHVVKIVDGKEEVVSIDNNGDNVIRITENTDFRVYYRPTEGPLESPVTFYDYVVKPYEEDTDGTHIPRPDLSINTASNYANSDSSQKLTAGIKEQNYQQNRYNAIISGENGSTKNANTYVAGEEGLVTGIVAGLDDDEYKNVVFNVDEPGFFSQEEKVGKTKLDNYELIFTRTGDTYQLDKVVEVVDSKKNVVAKAGADFFPLDHASSNVNDDACPRKTHNYYFGMRYDVSFTLGDYVGPLNYSFTGDDDLWVILDGKTVAVDVGGVHDALTREVDLWNVLGVSKDASERTDGEKTVSHRLTILYMERGGYESNCQMEFTLPSAQMIDVKDDTTSLSFGKVTSKGEPLAGAVFELTDNANWNNTATSTSEGTVTFHHLKTGTYTLTEIAAPDGYIAEDRSWVVNVVENAEGKLNATLYESDGVTEVQENKIVNYTMDEVLRYDKTAHLLDWDKRTYQIDLYAAHNLKVDMTADIVLALDISGSMPWFVTAPTGGTTTLAELNAIAKEERENLQSYGNAGVDAWNYTYYVARAGEGSATEYKPIGWNGSEWRFIKSKSDGSKTFEEKEIGIVKADETVYIRGEHDQTKLEALETAVVRFVTNVGETAPNSRIGLVTFAGEVYSEASLGNVTSENIGSVFEQVVLHGDTYQTAAMKTALELMNANGRIDAEKYIILLSDGDFNKGNEAEAENAANAIKNSDDSITLFTAGVFGDKECSGAKHMQSWATNTDSAYLASSADELVNSFYKIFGSINVEMQNVTIIDYIDSRFELIGEDGKPLVAGDSVNDGIVGQDNNGYYVIWESETLSYAATAREGWHKALTVRAKDEFIGGNNIPTNISPISGVKIKGGIASFPLPHVNVKVELEVGNAENTIFRGETVSTDAEILNKMFAGMIKEPEGEELDGYTFTWYKDKEFTNANQISLDDMAKETPDDTTEYYLVVAYDAGKTTEESNANSKIGDTVYFAGTPFVNNNSVSYMVRATNVADKDATGVKREYGVYTTYVVDGSITINKTIKASDYEAADGDPIFTFKITGTLADGKNVTFYKTVRFNTANNPGQGDWAQSATITGLAKGTYVVEELKTAGFDLKQDGVKIDGENAVVKTNCMSRIDNKEVAVFELGLDTEGNRFAVDTQQHTAQNGNLASVTFTNKRDRNHKITDTDVVKNSIVIGEKMSSNTSADNGSNAEY